jgi:hypothetical protein
MAGRVMPESLVYIYSIGIAFIVSAFASAMLAFVVEKYDLF